MADRLLGSIEAGGTKWNCAVGSGPDDLVAETRIPTTTPDETLAAVRAFFAEHEGLEALGVATFGPAELRRGHPAYGSITTTPKPHWSDTPLVGPLSDSLGVPVGFDTDVNGAALGEGRWGAAVGLDTFAYVTVGTGFGGGAVAGGRVAHGLVHPEMGHVSVRRHPDDDFPGRCPFHGDCLEGMACGPAMIDRWGRSPSELVGDERVRALDIEAHYLAEGFRNLVYVLAPQRIIMGGGVSKMDGLVPAVRAKLVDALGGYPGLPEHAQDDFVVPPTLGDRAGIAGGFVLAEQALS